MAYVIFNRFGTIADIKRRGEFSRAAASSLVAFLTSPPVVASTASAQVRTCGPCLPRAGTSCLWTSPVRVGRCSTFKAAAYRWGGGQRTPKGGTPSFWPTAEGAPPRF